MYQHFKQQGEYTEEQSNQTEKGHVCNAEEQLFSSSDQQTDVAVNNFLMDQVEYDLTKPLATQIHHTTITAVGRKQTMFTKILPGKLLPFCAEADTSSTTDSQSLLQKWEPSIRIFDVCLLLQYWEPYALFATVLEKRSPENLLLQDRKWLYHTNAMQDMDQQCVCLQDNLYIPFNHPYKSSAQRRYNTLLFTAMIEDPASHISLKFMREESYPHMLVNRIQRQTMQVISYNSLLGSFTFKLFPRIISPLFAREWLDHQRAIRDLFHQRHIHHNSVVILSATQALEPFTSQTYHISTPYSSTCLKHAGSFRIVKLKNVLMHLSSFRAAFDMEYMRTYELRNYPGKLLADKFCDLHTDSICHVIKDMCSSIFQLLE
jgi:hypothetical protein